MKPCVPLKQTGPHTPFGKHYQNVTKHAHLIKQSHTLKSARDAKRGDIVRDNVRKGHVINQDLSTVESEYPAQKMHKRSLARTIWSHESRDLTPLNTKCEV